MFKNLLYFSILTSVIVISWIGFEVYNSHVTSTISADQSIIITPIPPTFNQETILLIKSKKIVPANLSETSTRSAITITNPEVVSDNQTSQSAISNNQNEIINTQEANL